MFFNPGPGFAVILYTAILLIVATCAAHLFWFVRLTVSPAVIHRPRLQRIAILTAAFFLPVISFYAIHIACWWNGVRGKLSVRTFLPLALVILATVATGLFGSIRLMLRSPQYFPGWSDVIETIIGQCKVFALVQILLFMILRTALPGWRKAHIAGAAITLIPFLIFG